MADRSAFEFRALLDEVVQVAPRLRTAGVREVRIGDLSFRLAEPDVALPDADGAGPGREEVDGWNDPDLYGLPPGSKIPGMPRQRRD